MLQELNGTIRENVLTTTGVATITSGNAANACGYVPTWNGDYLPTSTITLLGPTTYWGNYPVYVCTDKTKKAIEVLKCLEADKTLKVTNVPKFIALVEKIAGLL